MARTEVRGGQILDASVSLTADVSGVLPIANGGTNSSSANTARTALGLVIGTDVAPVSSPTFTGTVTLPAGTLPCDFVLVSHSDTRATGIGDLAVAQYVGRAFTLTKVIYQFDTADASGSTAVETRRNGSQVTSSNLTVSAANQVDGTGTDSARTATISQSFAVGDRITPWITSLGTTPGKGLRAYYFGTWN